MVTLNELLLPAADDLTDRIKEALASNGIGIEGGGVKNPILGWRMMPAAIARHLPALLDIGFGDILVGAWNKSFALRQQIEKSLKTPGKEIFVQLSEHKITSTHKPYIALMKNGQEIGRLPFTVSIEIILQGAVVRILDGAVQEIQTGKVKGKGTVKCFEAILAQKELTGVSIPGTIQVSGTAASTFFSPRSTRRAS
jgi:hypothetical protein